MKKKLSLKIVAVAVAAMLVFSPLKAEAEVVDVIKAIGGCVVELSVCISAVAGFVWFGGWLGQKIKGTKEGEKRGRFGGGIVGVIVIILGLSNIELNQTTGLWAMINE